MTTTVNATNYVCMSCTIKGCLRLLRREATNINLKTAPDKSFFSIRRHTYVYLSDVYGNQRRSESLIMEAATIYAASKLIKLQPTKGQTAKTCLFSLFLRFVSLLFFH